MRRFSSEGSRLDADATGALRSVKVDEVLVAAPAVRGCVLCAGCERTEGIGGDTGVRPGEGVEAEDVVVHSRGLHLRLRDGCG